MKLTLPLTIVLVSMTLPVFAQDPTSAGAPAVYEKWCTPCHGGGEGKPGTIRPLRSTRARSLRCSPSVPTSLQMASRPRCARDVHHA